MKILWIGPNLLHPTTKGGQIRTLETLRQLQLRHEIHYLCFDNPQHPEARSLARQYSQQVFTISHQSTWLPLELLRSFISPLPVAVSRWSSSLLMAEARRLMAANSYDLCVCDFLAVAENVPDWERTVLFQHNVETSIWERHQQHAPSVLHRWYFGLQARRMRDYESLICRRAHHVIAVSDLDAVAFREQFGISHVSSVPTGVDLDFFAQTADSPRIPHDLVFVGSMDWRPNLDGMEWFLEEIWPIVRQHRPETTLAIVGRQPPAAFAARARSTPGVTVTGTVPDVRPYLWGSRMSIVPLRIGGGTRLKIYESMGASVPVVSTTIGAEGLHLTPGIHYANADDATGFATQCLNLLSAQSGAPDIAANALSFVTERFGWPVVAAHFERVLEGCVTAASASKYSV